MAFDSRSETPRSMRGKIPVSTLRAHKGAARPGSAALVFDVVLGPLRRRSAARWPRRGVVRRRAQATPQLGKGAAGSACGNHASRLHGTVQVRV